MEHNTDLDREIEEGRNLKMLRIRGPNDTTLELFAEEIEYDSQYGRYVLNGVTVSSELVIKENNNG